ncbi:gram positive anchor [Streptococcus oralis SK313]|uniref:Gram positive anchor n=1 Tax=Streptococcus oralis SK313 TaxID=1035190 RepID=F9Q4F3_STROR|nr:gram positive anchor [Streptococcus oralis SK313]
MTTPIAEAPQLPESVRTYDSNGHVSSAKVTWDTIRPEQYAKEGVFTVNGRLEGTQLTTKLHVRVSAQTEKGANISDQWTGSELPLAFASDSNPTDPVSNVNDKLISFNDRPANRWTNWNRTNPEASVGVLFGDSGILSKRSVDNLSVGFHEDHGVGVPKSYVIEYYVGKTVPTAPKNPSFVGEENHAFNDPANWKEVSNLKAPAQLKAGEMNHFSFDKVETYAVRIRMVRLDSKKGTSITEVQIFAKQVAAAKQGQTRIQVDGKDLANFNPDLTDYYLESADGKVPAVTASVSNNGLATVVPSVREGEPVRVIAKAENGDILGEYRLHFTSNKDLLSRKPVAAVKQARLLQVGQPLELPTKVPVYFTGKDGYETKDLAVEWEEVPAEKLTKAGQFTVRGRVLGSDLVAEFTVRVTDKLGEALSNNPEYDENSNRAFASATNDIDRNSHDRGDYLNDGNHSENRRWTNWSPTPSSNPEVSAGVIFRENGKIVERTVAQAKLHFFADSGTDAPSKLVLERYIGPDFEVPTYYSNYQAYDAAHPFNNPENWEAVPYRADKDIAAGDEINVTFKAVKTKAMRWRMERKADKSGVAMIEMTFLAPSELPQESTQSKILVDGKELPDFAEDRQDYQITYKGQRPKVSVEESNQVASTVVDSGDDSLPVLVRLVSESGKQVKEYRIQLTKEKPVSEKTVAAVQEELPKLEFVEKDLAYKTVEKKDSTLYLGETRVEQEGKVGKERIFTAVNPSGSKEEKLREVVEAPTDRIVLVGTKPGTSLPEDEVKNLVLNRPELVIEEETIDFKVQERKSDKLYLGETRILQEGQKGIRIHLIEVENGKRTEKESYDKVIAQDRIVEVGTKPGTSLPEDEVKNLVLNRPELVIEEETIDFKVQEQKNDKLPVGETRVLQEGQKGIRVHLIEVENGKRTEKESYDKVVAQDRIVEVGTAGETTKPVLQESTKPQVSEKTDTKQNTSSAAGPVQKEQLPNTGSAEGQAAVVAGLALLGLSAGLVATKGKKED